MKGKEYTKPVFFSSYESLWFGVPVIMNRFLMPGLILSITGTGIATYLMLQYNVCSRCCVFVPWMVPGILAGFIQTGGDPRFLIVMAVNFVLGLLIWLPFVKRYEREMSIPYLS